RDLIVTGVQTCALPIFGRGEQRGQHDARAVHAGAVVDVVVIQRVRGGAVGERGTRRRVAPLADEAGGRAALLPSRKARVELRDEIGRASWRGSARVAMV